eukprot:CAMPEP_0172926558 /NCGR_PEP_ID=MMETSP1075-20121228/215781_1 /TAXON_ID=2916 /ORGANISM="Ceratium fusus, Strain PA161109" /LENGTH=365 /DNA_ID=CAMNT_0013787647 /DNA_START=1 /DNA_END=1098 /DNA_ORIENTATION=-
MFADALSRPLNNKRERHRPRAALFREAASGNAADAGRLYEVVVRNLTGRHFQLNGDQRPRDRRVSKGRLLSLVPSLPAADDPAPALPFSAASALAPDPIKHAPVTAQAAFASDSTLGDVLEFTLAYSDKAGEGFTIRVHAHSCSPLRSDVVSVGQDLSVTSMVEEVPRLIARPPAGYEETALGVYKSATRSEDLRLGELRPGDEVLASGGPREGRWLRITSPYDGWVQAETRDGYPILVEQKGRRRHLRQVIVVRPFYAGPPPKAAQRVTSLPISTLPWALPRDHPNDEARAIERAYFSARASRAERLDKEAATLRAKSLLGKAPQATLLGALATTPLRASSSPRYEHRSLLAQQLEQLRLQEQQ